MATSASPVTCYIAGAMSKVPEKRREELSAKRKAIAKFFQDAYSITCSHYGVLQAKPESKEKNPTQEELQSIVARDLELVNSAEPFVLCYEGKSIYSWGAGIELGYAYSQGKTVVIFNLSKEDEPRFLLPDYAHSNKVYFINDEKSLEEFTKKYTHAKSDAFKDAIKELHKALYSDSIQREKLAEYIEKRYSLKVNFCTQKEEDLERKKCEGNQFVFCYKGDNAFKWEAAIDLGYNYGERKNIVVFNLSEEKNIYFFIRLLPQDANHNVWVIGDKKSLDEFQKARPQPSPQPPPKKKRKRN